MRSRSASLGDIMTKIQQLCALLGLHPLVAFGMIAVDMMLFGGESVTVGISWPISVAVGAVLTVPCILIQKYGMKEHWGLAIGKGMLIGVLTAIPTPIPSALSLVGGGLGTAALLGSGSKAKQAQEDAEEMKPGPK